MSTERVTDSTGPRPHEATRFVCFEVGGREHAAAIEGVRETLAVPPITPVFRTPPAVVGLCGLRGEILAVLDTGRLLGTAPVALTDATRMLVVDADGRSAALLVDALRPLRSIDRRTLAAPPSTLDPRVAALLDGIASLPDHPVAVVDLAALLSAAPLKPFADT